MPPRRQSQRFNDGGGTAGDNAEDQLRAAFSQPTYAGESSKEGRQNERAPLIEESRVCAVDEAYTPTMKIVMRRNAVCPASAVTLVWA